jgi:hypothetical protein
MYSTIGMVCFLELILSEAKKLLATMSRNRTACSQCDTEHTLKRVPLLFPLGGRGFEDGIF